MSGLVSNLSAPSLSLTQTQRCQLLAHLGWGGLGLATGILMAHQSDASTRLPASAPTMRVISMEAMYLLGFGPRLPQALGELHRATDV